MQHLNVEIKAKIDNLDQVRSYLIRNNADFKGVDEQVDTYFNTPHGRLKLREGKIENNLIYYDRPDQLGPKSSLVSLYRSENPSQLKEMLQNALGTRVVVHKKREIYFINNVKFHIDEIIGLGQFLEIEAIDSDGTLGSQKLHQQCQFYLKELNIDNNALISTSYSNLLDKNP